MAILTSRAVSRLMQACASGAIPVVLGGEHTVTYGAVAGVAESIESFGLVQLDAHADLRGEYSGTKWSHACVTRRIIEDFSLPVFQIGVRSICVEEQAARKTYGVGALDASTMARQGIPDNVLPQGFPENICKGSFFDMSFFDRVFFRTGQSIIIAFELFLSWLSLRAVFTKQSLNDGDCFAVSSGLASRKNDRKECMFDFSLRFRDSFLTTLV